MPQYECLVLFVMPFRWKMLAAWINYTCFSFCLCKRLCWLYICPQTWVRAETHSQYLQIRITYMGVSVDSQHAAVVRALVEAFRGSGRMAGWMQQSLSEPGPTGLNKPTQKTCSPTGQAVAVIQVFWQRTGLNAVFFHSEFTLPQHTQTHGEKGTSQHTYTLPWVHTKKVEAGFMCCWQLSLLLQTNEDLFFLMRVVVHTCVH